MPTYRITAEERSLLAAGALASDLGPTPRLLLTLTDEELLALTHGDEERTPWVERLQERVPGYGVDDAVLTGTRILLARGLTAQESVLARVEEREVIGEPGAVRASLVLTGILARKADPHRRVSVSREAGEGRTAVLLHVDADGTVLQEQVSPDGLHHFLVQDTASALRALGHLLPRDEEPTGPGALVRGTWDEIARELSLPGGEATRRLDVEEPGSSARETLWWSPSPRGPVLLRAADGADGPDGVLEASPLTAEEQQGLLRELLGAAQE